MFVERVEGGEGAHKSFRTNLLLTKQSDLQQIMRYNAISAVIDVSKSVKVQVGSPGGPATDYRRDTEIALAERFSPRELSLAKEVIQKTAPQVKEILMAAQLQNSVDMHAASDTVADIMAQGELGALIGLCKIKEIDEYTFLHSLSVSALLVSFGRALKVDEEMVHLFGLGGLVHDIGKSTIPVDILKKTGSLTADEFHLIKSHPERGYAILRRSDETVPEVVLDICRYHHEKYDGSGYPLQLMSAKIPYCARVAAICDVYDALTTIRPYKKAWTQAEAVDRMIGSHGHFDPKLLRTFVSRMILSGALV
ncbi:putative nucleotidyltransferase with HDIG domain [Rhizobium halophytocola]|uniref:Nucleotidyltransferase with HDIG domain n=2 Tax=Rhizobium halophytocola TaxID=735519 RepID=A0ABS4DUJ5_9HYPH|nr:putative nucleotidyltransferase with HDIG domain [Rhizobium halophytocola]